MKTYHIRHGLEGFWKEEDGVTAIEYALLAALIFVVIVGSVSSVGGAVKTLFEKVAAIFPLGN